MDDAAGVRCHGFVGFFRSPTPSMTQRLIFGDISRCPERLSGTYAYATPQAKPACHSNVSGDDASGGLMRSVQP
jgi:hypothetical protein